MTWSNYFFDLGVNRVLVSRVAIVGEAALRSKIQQSTIGEVAYGGRVVATVHDLKGSDTFETSSSSSTMSSTSPSQSPSSTTATATTVINLKTTWTFDWLGYTRDPGPFNGTGTEDQRRRSQMKWSVRVRNGMIDQERGGWIGKQDVVGGGGGCLELLRNTT